jgi:magnesium-transporting ATPase (P-type)
MAEIIKVEGLDKLLEKTDSDKLVKRRMQKMLRQAGLVPRLLYFIRVFGRVKPEGKIMVIDSFVDSGVVVGMCGDGGNEPPRCRRRTKHERS